MPTARWRLLVALAGGTIAPLSAQGRVVLADGAPVWGANVQLVPLVTIGGGDSLTPYAFRSVGRVVGLPDGGFVVYERIPQSLRRYDPAGRFVTAIGHPANGPDNYSMVVGLETSGDTTIIVWDGPRARLAHYTLDGALRRLIPLPTYGRYERELLLGVDTFGVASVPIALRPIRRFLRLGPKGEIRDTLSAPVAADRGFELETEDGPRGAFQSAPLAVAYTGGGLLLAHTDTLGFHLVRNTEPLTVRRQHTPVPLHPDERRRWERIVTRMYDDATRWRDPADTRSPLPTKLVIPTVKPALRGAMSDRDGRVWLELYVAAEVRHLPPRPNGVMPPSDAWWERNAFDVFSGAGQYLGRVTLPAQHRLMDARGDRIWAVSEGPDGEERIVVFRIVRG